MLGDWVSEKKYNWIVTYFFDNGSKYSIEVEKVELGKLSFDKKQLTTQAFGAETLINMSKVWLITKEALKE